MTAHCSTSHPLVIVGDVEQVRDLLCGPQQHNEHCRAWRWHAYVADDAKRWEAVKAELHKMHHEKTYLEVR